MALPTLPSWTTGQRVGAKDLNDATYRPSVWLNQQRPTGCIYLDSDFDHDADPTVQQVPMNAVGWEQGVLVAGEGITVTEPGIYLATAQVAVNDSANYVAARFATNNGSLPYRDTSEGNLTGGSGFEAIPLWEEFALDAGDTLRLEMYSTAARTAIGAATREDVGAATHLKLTWVAPDDDTLTGSLPATRKTWAAGDVPTAAQMTSEVKSPWTFLLSPPRCKATAPSTNTTSGSTLTVPLNATVWDTDSSLASNVLTLPVDGFYQVIAYGAFAASNSTNRREINVDYLNGSNTLIRTYNQSVSANATGYTRVHLTFVVAASAGHKLRFTALQNSGSTISFADPFLSYRWLGEVPA